ncbi:hypothetical protein DFR24_0974 [Panacagrimonas perspica]|uniref:HTH cro/C1-type domain-containing protein n=1 Tax=Panacagrimonas perspica TaxID=381431 RepID=A0A4S3K580_9GAMM|nr:helix-turn-helix domain-containing protein [Panacagrimonas perspica]TDU31604.1 hypothetical protein DFR24_0974 [Panacagrimonas perspica]THD03168.1 hypothetical protein B1810_11375 [Panacagrimonas perspica]
MIPLDAKRRAYTPSQLMELVLRAQLLEKRRQHLQRLANIRLDQAKGKTGSDWATARELHITPQRLSDVRKGRRRLTPESAVRLARLLDTQPFTALAHAMADNAKNRQSRHFWLMVGLGQWPFIPDSYNDWAHSSKKRKYSTGGY